MELGINNVQQIPSRTKGQILLYSGRGKGKSQISLGVALRMIGLGISQKMRNRVLIVRFLKGNDKGYSEDTALRAIEDKYPHLVDVVNTGTGNHLSINNRDIKDFNEAKRGWEIAKGAIQSNLYSLVILDELNPVLDLGLIHREEAIPFLNKFKKENYSTELVITGVNPPSEIINLSDLHSEVLLRNQNSILRTNLIENYIGTGKGKSTSALGKVLKYVGDNKKVLIVQFLKGGKGYTEDAALQALMESFPKKIDHYHCGRSVIVFKGKQEEADYLEAEKGWAIVKAGLKLDYDLIVLDEINPTIDLELLNKDEVVETLKNSPICCDIITTGRAVSDIFYEETYNISCHKHYSMAGVELRTGIDY